MGSRQFAIAGAFALAASLSTAPARAGGFLADGSYVFDHDSAYAESFEDHEPQSAYDVVEADDALEGTHIFSCNAPVQTVGFGFPFPPAQSVYEATIWIRGEGLAGLVVRAFSRRRPTSRVCSSRPPSRSAHCSWMT